MISFSCYESINGIFFFFMMFLSLKTRWNDDIDSLSAITAA